MVNFFKRFIKMPQAVKSAVAADGLNRNFGYYKLFCCKTHSQFCNKIREGFMQELSYRAVYMVYILFTNIYKTTVALFKQFRCTKILHGIMKPERDLFVYTYILIYSN